MKLTLSSYKAHQLMYLADPLLNIVNYLTDIIFLMKCKYLMYETNPLKIELHHLCIKPTLQTIMCNI